MTGDLLELERAAREAMSAVERGLGIVAALVAQVDESLVRLGAHPSGMTADVESVRAEIRKTAPVVPPWGPGCRAAMTLTQASQAWGELSSQRAEPIMESFGVVRMAKDKGRGDWSGDGMEEYSATVNHEYGIAKGLTELLAEAAIAMSTMDETVHSWWMGAMGLIIGMGVAVGSMIWAFVDALNVGLGLLTALEASGAVIGAVGGMAAAEVMVPLIVPLGFLAAAAIALCLAANGLDVVKRDVIEGQAQKLTALSDRLQASTPWRPEGDILAAGRW
jgi:hypothetical protein